MPERAQQRTEIASQPLVGERGPASAPVSAGVSAPRRAGAEEAWRVGPRPPWEAGQEAAQARPEPDVAEVRAEAGAAGRPGAAEVPAAGAEAAPPAASLLRPAAEVRPAEREAAQQPAAAEVPAAAPRGPAAARPEPGRRPEAAGPTARARICRPASALRRAAAPGFQWAALPARCRRSLPSAARSASAQG